MNLNNNEYSFDCDVLSPPTNNTIDKIGASYALLFNYAPKGVGLAVNNKIGFDLIAALTETTATIINENENKNGMILKNWSITWTTDTDTKTSSSCTRN